MAASNRRRFLFAALVALIAIGTLLFFARGPRTQGADPPPLAVATVAGEAAPAPPPPAASRVLSPMPSLSVPQAPLVVDEITVEKSEVCEGEENLIQVRAHSLDSSDAFLHYTVAGQRGQAVPVRTYLLPDGTARPQVITVFGRGSASATVDVPAYRVKECQPERTLLVGYQTRPNTVDELDFEARVVERSGNAFRPVHYLWDFGDGSTENSTQPFRTHSYAHRTQAGMYSNHLVVVRAFGESGDTLVGRAAIEFLNLAYHDLEKFGTISLVAQRTPRYPAPAADGVVLQKFEIWHYYREPVEIERIHVLRLDLAGNRHDEADLDPGVLDRREIGVGESVHAELSFDTNRYPETLALVYRFEGTSADGRRAAGEFSVMTPPPKPTRENSVLVSDPKRLRKIKMALSILGKDTVSQEEMWQLEREGKLPREEER